MADIILCIFMVTATNLITQGNGILMGFTFVALTALTIWKWS